MATEQKSLQRRALRTRIRERVPGSARRRALHARHWLRARTPGDRALPHFLIIGTQRGGTSSLFRYLSTHPQVAKPLRKETEYFAGRYDRGIDWYLAHFPRSAALGSGRRRATFEATPDYMLDPRAARRAAEVLPEARLIALIRDPIERAHSNYRHMRKLGFEPLSFAEAVRAEEDRCAAEWDRVVADRVTRPLSLLRYSYLRRGHYAEHLVPWLDRFGAERVKIVVSERLFTETRRVYGEILSFLELDPWAPRSMPNHSPPLPAAEGIEDGLRAGLIDHFQPHNDHLRDLLGYDPGWGY